VTNVDTSNTVLSRLDERLLSVDEAAAVLALSRASVYRVVREGGIQPYRIRGRWRFTPEQLREYIASGLPSQRAMRS
jgi:excisionase family DNA binding protein